MAQSQKGLSSSELSPFFMPFPSLWEAQIAISPTSRQN